MKKNPEIFLKHILESIAKIEQYIKGKTEREFLNDYEQQDAIIRRIEIIGEATKNLPLEFKKKHSSIEWREITGMRDKLIHEYFGVNLDMVWEVIRKDIPKLKKQISKLLEEFKDKKYDNSK